MELNLTNEELAAIGRAVVDAVAPHVRLALVNNLEALTATLRGGTVAPIVTSQQVEPAAGATQQVRVWLETQGRTVRARDFRASHPHLNPQGVTNAFTYLLKLGILKRTKGRGIYHK